MDKINKDNIGTHKILCKIIIHLYYKFKQQNLYSKLQYFLTNSIFLNWYGILIVFEALKSFF